MDYFDQALSKEAFHLPFLLHGGEAPLLEKRAIEGAEKILGSKTDLLIIRPDPKSFTFAFAHLKESLQALSLPPHEGKYKVLVLLEIEKMLPVHISLLLKTLEEKPSYSVIFLTSANSEALLPTILSRCVKIFIKGEVSTEGLQEIIPRLLESSLRKNYAGFYSLLEEIKDDASLESILFLTLAFFRDLEIVRNSIDHPLFFEKEKELFTKLLSCPTPSYPDLVEAIETAEVAFQTHTKMRVLLEHLFLEGVGC